MCQDGTEHFWPSEGGGVQWKRLASSESVIDIVEQVFDIRGIGTGSGRPSPASVSGHGVAVASGLDRPLPEDRTSMASGPCAQGCRAREPLAHSSVGRSGPQVGVGRNVLMDLGRLVDRNSTKEWRRGGGIPYYSTLRRCQFAVMPCFDASTQFGRRQWSLNRPTTMRPCSGAGGLTCGGSYRK